MRVAAVDWSGRATGAPSHIWLAVVDGDGLVRLESGRSRQEIADELLRMALADPNLAADC
jgi:hypothetical protein